MSQVLQEFEVETSECLFFLFIFSSVVKLKKQCIELLSAGTWISGMRITALIKQVMSYNNLNIETAEMLLKHILFCIRLMCL